MNRKTAKEMGEEDFSFNNNPSRSASASAMRSVRVAILAVVCACEEDVSGGLRREVGRLYDSPFLLAVRFLGGLWLFLLIGRLFC